MVQRLILKTESITWFTDDLAEVVFLPPQPVEFIAGQYMSLAVDGFIRRSYSIANPPHEPQKLVTYVDSRPGGPGSRFFLQLQAGQDVNALVPLGRFIYEPESRPAYFFATGTGVVPLLSMIRHELETVKSGRQVVLYYGVRSQERIMIAQQLEQLQATHKNFIAHIHLTQPPAAWTGSIGRFTEVLNQIPDTNAQAYICGGFDMIQDVVTRLTNLGFAQQDIFYERYY